MQAVIFCGIQATGKSTFYKQHFFNTHVRISLDLLRTRNRERQFLELCLKTQARFVVDNTNPSVAERAVYVHAARSARYRVIGYHFVSSVAEALSRNEQRTGKEVVPEKGIRGTHNRLQPPAFSEGFDQLFTVRIEPGGLFSVTETFMT